MTKQTTETLLTVLEIIEKEEHLPLIRQRRVFDFTDVLPEFMARHLITVAESERIYKKANDICIGANEELRG